MDITGMIHQVCWKPGELSIQPLSYRNVVFLARDGKRDERIAAYQKQLRDEGFTTTVVRHDADISASLGSETIIVHVPSATEPKENVYETVTRSCNDLVAIAQKLQQHSHTNMDRTPKLFSLVRDITALSHAPLTGLARVLKMEIPHIFGGMFEEDQEGFPSSAIKYAQGYDVIRIVEGVAQIAHLQPCPSDLEKTSKLQMTPDSCYLITGGTRGVGLEIATWMCERGARSLILLSRRGLPPAGEPTDADTKLISRIRVLEARGAKVYVLAIDISKPGADVTLKRAIDDLHVPPVKGVVHAAGIAAYHTLDQCSPSDVADVLAPKVLGALNLDKLYPAGNNLDFMVLTSSVGQLVGFPGQLSYAPANAFLDGLATYRRSLGDNTTSIQWTCWRDLGMLSQSKSATRMITRGMHARGFGDMSKEEAFAAWDRIAALNTDIATVVRVTELEADEPIRHPMFRNITPRKGARTSSPRHFTAYPEHAVAIVGMACRTAAGDTPEDLWGAISSGASLARPIDAKRFPNASPWDKLWGNFLSDIDSFDHQFFKKSKREAAALDPHQRVLLETTYHALESAGWFGGAQSQESETHAPSSATPKTGCFIGMNAPDYAVNLACHPASPYTGFGMLRSFVSGRLSHFFGWTGPSQTIDTACSSSMVAVHQACRALQLGECTRAVAGGVNLITNTVLQDAMRVGGFLNETGPCKTFDARADGYCRGEAVGVVVLKPLRVALAEGDAIQGVLLATGNNQNINSTSITNPVLESQAALYRDVLARAGVQAGDVSYIEAHGTGTRAGDPIELGSIREVLGSKERAKPLHVGAVKANVGHSEGAAGVVSLIKTLLMLKHGKITPQANFEKLNPNIPALEPDGMKIATTLKEWDDDLRLAMVNSYGASGNNACCLLAPAPPRSSGDLPMLREPVVSAWPVFISANTKDKLLAYCIKLKTQIESGKFAGKASDLAFALATHQNRKFQHVFCSTASSLDELRVQLADPVKYITAPQGPKPVVLLFSGQNGTTVPSAKPLYASSVLFRKHIHDCDKVVQSLGYPSILPAVLEGLQDGSGLVHRHAAMFSIQYSSGMSWIDSGLKPQAICGHSFGEWAALTVSGAMTLEAGMRLTAGRASIIEKFWGEDTGSMIAIEADMASKNCTPDEYLKSFYEKHPESRLDVACYNVPNNFVVAGSTTDIQMLEWFLGDKKAAGEKIRFKALWGMHAYHSVMADPIVDECAKLSATISFQEPTLPFESCHKDPWSGPGENVIARNTRGPVYFGQAISRIVDRLGPCTFLESGVSGPIIPMARLALLRPEFQAQHSFVTINSKDAVRSLVDATVTLWNNGWPQVQFWLFHLSQRASYVQTLLPQYQFEKSRHFLEYTGLGAEKSKKAEEPISKPRSETCPHCLKDVTGFAYIAHDISGSQGEARSVFNIDPRSRRYRDLVKGHLVVGTPICPAPVYLELVSHAVVLLHQDSVKMGMPEITVEALRNKAPLSLDLQRSIKLTLNKKRGTSWTFEFSSTKGAEKPTVHATGIASLRNTRSTYHQQDERDTWSRITSLLEKDTDTDALRDEMVYRVFESMCRYDPMYKGLRHLAGKGSEGAGDIKLPADNLHAMAQTPNSSVINPLLLDNFFQVPGAFIHSLRVTEDQGEHGPMAYICTGMDSVGPLNGLNSSGQYRAYTRIVREDNKEVTLDLFALDKQTKKIIWSAEGLKFQRIPRASLAKTLAVANPATEIKDEPAVSPKTTSSPSKTYKATTATPPSTITSPKALPVASLKDNREASTHVLADIREILSKSSDVPVQDIKEKSLLDDDLGLDSLVSSEILASIGDRFSIVISAREFAAVTDVASLCELITTKTSPLAVTATPTVLASRPPPKRSSVPADILGDIQDILSKSLDVPREDCAREQSMEDLGMDSLVSSEVLANVAEKFNIDVSTSEFGNLTDVASLRDLVATKLVSSRLIEATGQGMPIAVTVAPVAVAIAPKTNGVETSSKTFDTVQQILGISLNVPIDQLSGDVLLEDAGVDSLVSSEIIASISEKFAIDISSSEFAANTTVATLCTLISTKLGGNTTDVSDKSTKAPVSDLITATATPAPVDWQKTTFQILSESLDIPIAEAEKLESTLEDLGADTLVASEIISNMNEALAVNISLADWNSFVDVASLCDFIATTLAVDSVQDSTASSTAGDAPESSAASGVSTPSTGLTTPTTGLATPAEPQKPVSASTPSANP